MGFNAITIGIRSSAKRRVAVTDPYWSSVVAVLHGESLVDSSSTNATITNHGVTINNATYKYGAGSLYFNGSGYLTMPDNELYNLGSNNFTIEAYIHQTARSGSNGGIIGKQRGTVSYGEYCFTTDSSGKIVFAATTGGEQGGSWNLISITSSIAIPLNAWTHVAVTRSGTTLKLWIGGVCVGTGTASGSITNGTSLLSIGSNKDGGQYSFTGYIDEVRITNGVARYTTSFTPPASAFPDQ